LAEAEADGAEVEKVSTELTCIACPSPERQVAIAAEEGIE
jgi:hypothetical protein